MADDDDLTGVTALDHTADVGLEITAPTLPELFLRAARGLMWLIRGGDAPPERGDPPGLDPGSDTRAPERRTLLVTAVDLPALLRNWLRELHHWHEAEGLALEDARFEALEDTHVDATVTVVPDPREPVREIKGVTLHGLSVKRRGDDWVARVIFDV